MKKIALVTGATSGIGEATARILASEYYLIICGRRQDRLDNLKKELSVTTDVETLNFDVRDKNGVFEAIESLPKNWQQIDVLINNAGNAHGLSPIHEGDIDDWDAMIDINVKGLLYLSKAVVPGMVERKTGHIVNVGSIAGKEVYPNGNVYCASKFAVDAINNGMRLDLNKHGIKVSQVSPGLVETEFSMVRFKGDEKRSEKVYEGFDPLTGHDVAETIQYILSRPPHVLLSDIVMFPTAQASSTIVNRQG
ncbi:MAG: SDR family NAD(P)-dependent oxidoreductase [Cyclobacteriaceae bacterium]